MSKITCKLFGVPQIIKDGQTVFLPYAKINALLYYMLVTKVVSRDELAGLLWPDADGATAKKNIRNAVYQAKKVIDEDIIISPKKSVLILNKKLDIESDIDLFTRSPRENLHLYSGDFLQGFFLKDCESYESWISKMRIHYEEKFSAECYSKVEEDIKNKKYEHVERHIRKLIELDEFDEKNFRLLMFFYQQTGRNGKVIETYFDLAKILRRELGINPDKKTQSIYEQTLEKINFGDVKKESHEPAFFYGRYDELATLDKTIQSFKQKQDGKSILITGETGVGKTTLSRNLLNNFADEFFILKSNCYQAEQDIPLRGLSVIIREISRLIHREHIIPEPLWNDIMENCFPDFSQNIPGSKYIFAEEKPPFDYIVHVIVEVFIKFALQKQVILYIDNIQWMDGASLRLLTAVLLESDPLSLLMVATCGKEHHQETEDFLTTMRYHERLTTISLEPFSIEACHHFIEEALPNKELQGSTLERIYNETEGNPFFLSEYIKLLRDGGNLNTLTPTMIEVIKNRFVYFSSEQMSFIGTLSYFYDKVSLDFLLRFTEKEEQELFRLLKPFHERHILKEVESEQGIAIAFTHLKLREYIYSIQPKVLKKAIHHKIGLLLESFSGSNQENITPNASLIYHFSAAGDYLRSLKYQINTLNYYLNFSHEMFPILDSCEEEVNVYMSREQIKELFLNIQASFKDIQSTIKNSTELELLEVEFLYINGRYLIREGRYEDGVSNITYVIEKSKQLENKDYMLEGYKQMILYCLQVNKLHEMSDYIELALNLAVKCNYHKEIGIILRLKGLYNMMSGNYHLAEKLLTESINTLAVTENVAQRYITNIAAAYNYIGEIRQAEENYEESLMLFNKAISLCRERNVLSSLSYFYINAGKTAYFMNDITAARAYFNKAYSLYDGFDSFWRRPVLDSYLALIMIFQESYEDALHHLISAQKNVEHIKDPCERGTVCFAEALIRKRADEDKRLSHTFDDALPETAKYYYNKALKNLSKYCNRFEIKVLAQTFPPPMQPFSEIDEW